MERTPSQDWPAGPALHASAETPARSVPDVSDGHLVSGGASLVIALQQSAGNRAVSARMPGDSAPPPQAAVRAATPGGDAVDSVERALARCVERRAHAIEPEGCGA